MTDLPIRVYTPESVLRYPHRLVREMFADLWASRGLAWRLFVRDINARYRQSLLGYLWAFFPPIAGTLTFVVLNRSGVLVAGETSIPYPAFVMIGTLLWQVFVDSVSSPIRTVIAARSMLSKINFPREAILLSGVLEVLFNFLVRLVLLVAVFVYFKIAPPVTTPLAVMGVFAIVCLGFMIGILLTPVGILYTDVSQALTIALSFLMLFTPVVYTPPAGGTLALLTNINPVSPLIVSTRELLTIGATSQLMPACIVFAVTLVLLCAGWVMYRLAMPILVERMGG